MERKTQAEVLLNAYSRDLERRRLAAGARGLLLSETGVKLSFEISHLSTNTTADYEDAEDEESGSDEEFHYPGASPLDTIRPSSRSSGSTSDYFTRPGVSRAPTDLTPQLSQAPDFRVPTHEVPQKVLAPRWAPTPHQMHAQWERDEAVHQCRDCQRRFNFITRRVRSPFLFSTVKLTMLRSTYVVGFHVNQLSLIWSYAALSTLWAHLL